MTYSQPASEGTGASADSRNRSDGILPIIMAGGAGTRLWPLSREQMPKQFIALMSEGLSTFQETLKRVSGPDFLAPIVVTGSDFRFIVAEQMQAAGIAGTIVLEPERRDSAAAVAVGALLGLDKGPNKGREGDGRGDARAADRICLVLAADHVIPDAAAFTADCLRAAQAARTGRIMTLGIRPNAPSSAYGYIEPGEALDVAGAHAVSRFVEKPDAATAQGYVEAGMLWNSGNFLFPASLMVEELEAKAPAVLGAARAALDGAKRDLDFVRLDETAFAASPKISIDYAVMETTRRAGVLAASFNWSDVGAWDALHAISPSDGNGNVVEGHAFLFDTKDSLVRSEGALTAVVGLENVVVVTTPDAVLVADKAQAGKVKDVVAQLLAANHREATQHLRVHRPWGWYQRIDIGDRFQVKQICVNPGAVLSLQRHFHRAEHWVVVHGTAEVTVDDAVRIVHENEAAYLPIGCVHRLHNPGRIDLKIIEVQVGSYTGEDDIVRLEDVYARA